MNVSEGFGLDQRRLGFAFLSALLALAVAATLVFQIVPASADPVDSDGDGIPDVEELGPCSETAEIHWNHNEENGQSQSATLISGAQHFSSSTDLSFGPGLFENPDFAYTYLLGGADQTDFVGAKTNNDYVQVSFTPSQDLLLNEVAYGFWTSNSTDQEFAMGDFKIAAEYATVADFSNAMVIQQDVQVGAMVSGGYVTPTVPPVSLILSGSTEHFFRFYFYDEQNADPENRVRFDDLFFPTNVVSSCAIDSDGDGTPDHLDAATTTTVEDTTTTTEATTTTVQEPTTTAEDTTTTTQETTTTVEDTTTTQDTTTTVEETTTTAQETTTTVNDTTTTTEDTTTTVQEPTTTVEDTTTTTEATTTTVQEPTTTVEDTTTTTQQPTTTVEDTTTQDTTTTVEDTTTTAQEPTTTVEDTTTTTEDTTTTVQEPTTTVEDATTTTQQPTTTAEDTTTTTQQPTSTTGGTATTSDASVQANQDPAPDTPEVLAFTGNGNLLAAVAAALLAVGFVSLGIGSTRAIRRAKTS